MEINNEEITTRNKIILCIFYGFPVFVVIHHICMQLLFVKSNWFIYIIGVILILYSSKDLKLKEEKVLDDNIPIRRVYFTLVYFFILFISPTLNTYVIWKNESLWGLSKYSSNIVAIIGIATIIYIIIISNFNISEISVGNTKITMLKEKYKDIVNDHEDLANVLFEKIEVENKLMSNLLDYSTEIKEKSKKEGELSINQEYKNLIDIYFENMDEENINVSIMKFLDENEIKKDYKLKENEYNQLSYDMNHEKVYSFKKENIYYTFFPYSYRLEFPNKVYIILDSETRIINKVEKQIISNLLMKFTDNLLEK